VANARGELTAISPTTAVEFACMSSTKLTAMGVTMAIVAQLVPVANAIAPAKRNTQVGSKRMSIWSLKTLDRYPPVSSASRPVIADNAHASHSTAIAGSI
jgi:hypothetical protein